MFGHGAQRVEVDSTGLYYLTTNLVLFIIMAFCSTQMVYKAFMKFSVNGQNYKDSHRCGRYSTFMVCIAYLVNETYNRSCTSGSSSSGGRILV